MQGFNMGRYVPPDLEGIATGNQLNRSRVARGRPPTVRFEMPFAIWCLSCPKPTLIGQGVRFNAEKRQTGSYHSTRIWTFRLKHADCGGAIEIRTDPENTAYVVVSGARKHNVGGGDDEHGHGDHDGGEEGRHAVMTDEERQRLRKDAIANLEKTIEDRERLVLSTQRLGELAELSSRQWQDPALQNKRLRDGFRRVRKQAEQDASSAEALKDRMGLDIDIVPENEADSKRAALAEFGPLAGGEYGQDDDRGYLQSMSKSLFPTRKPFTPEKPVKGRLKGEREAARTRQTLASEILRNSRTTNDPFLAQPGSPSGESGNKATIIPPRAKKRKRDSSLGTDKDSAAVEAPPKVAPEASSPKTSLVVNLVDYDSD